VFDADLADFEKYIEPTEYEGLELVGAGLYYSNTISLYLQFTLPADEDKAELRITNLDTDDKIVYEYEDLIALDNDGTTYTLISELGILNLGTMYGIELGTIGSRGRFTCEQYVEYGALSYVYSMQESADAALAALVQATYNYGASAEDYTGK
jgi:hypothetical protein